MKLNTFFIHKLDQNNTKDLIQKIRIRSKNFFHEPSYKKIMVISLLSNIIVFGLFHYIAFPSFETPDDFHMMYTASGFRTGTPSEYLVFTNIIIGKALKFMYNSFSGINWYSIYLYLTHFLAMTVLISCFLIHKFRWTNFLKFLILFLAFELPLLMKLQFTSSAFVIGMSGIVLLITTLKEKRNIWFLSASIILFVISGLIRPQVFLLILLLTLPFMILKFRESKTSQILVFLGFSLILFFASVQYNNNYYSAQETWKAYQEYNTVRGKLHGYPNLRYDSKNAPVYGRVGWSKNDYEMFKTWFFYDQTVYSKKNLVFILSNTKNQRTIKEISKVFSTSVYPYIGLVLIGILCILLSLICENSFPRIPILIIFLVTFIVFLYLVYSARLPFRIFGPLVFFVSAISLLSIKSFYIKRKIVNNIIVSISLLIISLLLINQISILRTWNNMNKTNTIVLKETLKVIPSGRDKLYITWWPGNSLKWQFTYPFSNLDEYQNLIFLNYACLVSSPLNEEIKMRFGINNVFTSFYEKDNVFMILNDDRLYQNMFKQYLLEHYGQKVRFQTVSKYGDINVFKISSVGMNGNLN